MAIICHCEGVRDRTIASAVKRGATDLAAGTENMSIIQ